MIKLVLVIVIDIVIVQRSVQVCERVTEMVIVNAIVNVTGKLMVIVLEV